MTPFEWVSVLAMLLLLGLLGWVQHARITELERQTALIHAYGKKCLNKLIHLKQCRCPDALIGTDQITDAQRVAKGLEMILGPIQEPTPTRIELDSVGTFPQE